MEDNILRNNHKLIKGTQFCSVDYRGSRGIAHAIDEGVQNILAYKVVHGTDPDPQISYGVTDLLFGILLDVLEFLMLCV
jgi:hypothetical protein